MERRNRLAQHVLWRSENLANYLTKAKQVYVEGRLQTRSYGDRDAVKRYVTEIVADGVILLGGQQAGAQDQHASSKNGLVSQLRGRAVAQVRLLLVIPAARRLRTPTSPFDFGPRGL